MEKKLQTRQNGTYALVGIISFVLCTAAGIIAALRYPGSGSSYVTASLFFLAFYAVGVYCFGKLGVLHGMGFPMQKEIRHDKEVSNEAAAAKLHKAA